MKLSISTLSAPFLFAEEDISAGTKKLYLFFYLFFYLSSIKPGHRMNFPNYLLRR